VALEGHPEGQGLIVDAVIVENILEANRLLGKQSDQLPHRLPRTVEEYLEGGKHRLAAKPRAEFLEPLLGYLARGRQRQRIPDDHLRSARVASDEIEQVRLQNATLVELDRRYLEAFLEDLGRLCRHPGRGIGSNVHMVSPGNAPGDELCIEV